MEPASELYDVCDSSGKRRTGDVTIHTGVIGTVGASVGYVGGVNPAAGKSVWDGDRSGCSADTGDQFICRRTVPEPQVDRLSWCYGDWNRGGSSSDQRAGVGGNCVLLDVVLEPETGGSRPWLNCFASGARRSISALSSDFSRSHTSWVTACLVRSLVRISENRSFNCLLDVNPSCVA